MPIKNAVLPDFRHVFARIPAPVEDGLGCLKGETERKSIISRKTSMLAMLQQLTLQVEVSRGIYYWFGTRPGNRHHFAGNRYTGIPVAVEHDHAGCFWCEKP
jgi:hypothetical protein